MKTIPEEHLVYVDETGIDQYLHREFAYSPRGEKVYDKISGKKYKRTNILAGICQKKQNEGKGYKFFIISICDYEWLNLNDIIGIGCIRHVSNNFNNVYWYRAEWMEHNNDLCRSEWFDGLLYWSIWQVKGTS